MSQYLAGVTVPASRSPTPHSIHFNRDGSLRHVELKASGFNEEVYYLDSGLKIEGGYLKKNVKINV